MVAHSTYNIRDLGHLGTVRTKADSVVSKSGHAQYDRFIIVHSTRPLETLPRGRTSLHAVHSRLTSISRRCHSTVCPQSPHFSVQRAAKTKSPPGASFVPADLTWQKRTNNSPPPKPGGANITCIISTPRSTQTSSNPRSASTRVGRVGGTR